jgi:NAD(P)-dependent dehydrogenase (short-subunit alcohol dehydrogenase family)
MSKKTVIVTGVAGGLGFAIAEAYLKRGYNVVGSDISTERLKDAAARLGNPANFVGVPGDIAKKTTATEIFARAIEAFGKVDVLVNNAGIFIPKQITEYTEEEVNLIVGTNLLGFFYPAQAAAAHMTANKSGHIVNITAGIALNPNVKTPAILPILIKGGLNSATAGLALELASSGVKVNAVAPGIIQTPMHAKDEATQAFLHSLNPTGTVGRPQDIAEAVIYLTESNYTTGAVLPVDGGMSTGTW